MDCCQLCSRKRWIASVQTRDGFTLELLDHLYTSLNTTGSAIGFALVCFLVTGIDLGRLKYVNYFLLTGLAGMFSILPLNMFIKIISLKVQIPVAVFFDL